MTTSARRYERGGQGAAATAATVRRLTDPLGASGHRRTRERIQRERRSRRALFSAAVTAFLAIFGAFLLGEPVDQPATPADNRVIWTIAQDGTIQQVRVVDAEIAQARTRSS